MIMKIDVKSYCKDCGKSVGTKDHALQCDKCDGWLHAKCAGIPSDLYLLLRKHSVPRLKLFCQKCDQTNQCVPCNLSNSDSDDSAANITCVPPISSPPNVEVKDDKLTLITSTLQCLTDGIASLNARVSELDSSIRKSPMSQAGTKVLQLSRHEIENAAAAQADADIRAKRLLIRGLPFTQENTIDVASRILAPLSVIHPHLKITSASWFFRRDPSVSRPLLVSLANAGQRSAVIQSRSIISSTFPGVSAHPDLPVSKRCSKKGTLPPSVTIPIAPCTTSNAQSADNQQATLNETLTVPATPPSIYASPIPRSPIHSRDASPQPAVDSPGSCTLRANHLTPVFSGDQHTALPTPTIQTPNPAPQPLIPTLPALQTAAQLPRKNRSHFRPRPLLTKKRKHPTKVPTKLTSPLLGPPNLLSIQTCPTFPFQQPPPYHSMVSQTQPSVPLQYLHQLSVLMDLLPLLSRFQPRM